MECEHEWESHWSGLIRCKKCKMDMKKVDSYYYGIKTERKRIKNLIKEKSNPDYECKCSWKGKTDDMDYDRDAIEWSCPKCGEGINIGMHPQRHLAFLEIIKDIGDEK